MFKSYKGRIVSATIGGLLLAVSISGAAFASTNPTQTANTPPAKATIKQEALSDFAANLGISQCKVISALKTTKQQLVQEAVQQGKITQAQANKIMSHKFLSLNHHGKHIVKNIKGNQTKK